MGRWKKIRDRALWRSWAGGGWKADKEMEAAVTLPTSKADGADGADKEMEAAVTSF